MPLFNKTTLALLLGSLVAAAQGRPNIIIMQPDDFPFMNEWVPPPRNPTDPADHSEIDNAGNGLGNINRLRLDGLQMMQAYTASPVCGTSRYSTITGKMPSRAASGRDRAEANSDEPATVTIPTTKLLDVNGQNDCTEDNLAMAFKSAENPYRTGMFGKWHLSEFEEDTYTYDLAVETVQSCGFDTVGGLYVENLVGFFTEHGNNEEKAFGHNMEFMTYEAINFINETVSDGENFFMYFNPTVPHSSDDVLAAIDADNCEIDIPDPNFSWSNGPLWIKGMVEESEDETDRCRTYRKTIQDRAVDDDDQGKIWVDDAVGALLTALEDNGVLDDTIFLFQLDHGMDTKGGLYEGGIRIPQFIHYPNGIAEDSTFDGLVSTVDIAATMLDFAGIPAPYEMDGKSWKDVVPTPDNEEGNPSLAANWRNERCLFFENGQDRAARCGCYKYLNIFDETSSTYKQGRAPGWGLANNINDNLFDLCGGTGSYIVDSLNNQEEATVENELEQNDLQELLECHLSITDPDNQPVYAECSTTSAPTSAPSAYDCSESGQDQFSFTNNSGLTKTHSCNWLSNARNKSRLCNRHEVSSVCPVTCNACS
jgi:arylsulfatase A-like enzyme